MAKHRKRSPFPSREQIVEFVQESSGQVDYRKIARAFGISGRHRETLKSIVRDLERQRLINSPKRRRAGERSVLPKTTADGPLLLKQLLDGLDQRHEVDAAATIVAQYFKAGYPVQPLINTLVFAVVREDVDFHALQVIEAAVRQYELWGATEQGEHILIAATRYLAAHCPTQRAGLQTARIALRLHRGDKIYEEDM